MTSPSERPGVKYDATNRLLLDVEHHDALLDWLEARRELPVSEGGGGWTGGFDVLVDTSAYTGIVAPQWCPFERIAPGTAAVYPYKARMPNGATGQYRRSELLGIRVWLPVHPDFPPEIPGERLNVEPPPPSVPAAEPKPIKREVCAHCGEPPLLSGGPVRRSQSLIAGKVCPNACQAGWRIVTYVPQGAA